MIRGDGCRPRLLFLTPDFPPAHGGVQSLVHGLARALTGFEVVVLTLDGAGASSFDSGSGISTRRVTVRGRGPRRRVIALNAAAVRRAAAWRPDVVLSAHVVVSPAAAVIRRLFGARTVQYFYGNEILHRPRLAAFASRAADAPVAAAGGASAVEVIPPGIDLVADGRGEAPEHPTLLTVAQLKHAYKGHDVVIEALAEVSARVADVRWVVIGEGPLRADLEGRVRVAGLGDRVRFLGEVADRERDRWMRRCEVFVMPSRLPGEGFGIAFLEAGARGKPVVAGNVGGPLEAVEHGVSGLLVDPCDPRALADALSRLLLDRDLAGRLGRGGARRAREFAWPTIAARLEASMHALLERPA